MSKLIGWAVAILVIVGLINLFSGPDKTETKSDNNFNPSVKGLSTPSPSPSQFYYPSAEEDSEYSAHDEDVNRYEELSGSYTVEACNNSTGNCYDLDADISDGQVGRIYFPNGGHLDLDGAELDEDGYASGESYTESEGYNGDEWEVNCYDCE